ncbi:phosphoribosylanthranilate isomerase [Candidatus Methylospira mobilis]|uniref:N-(5'-phosphoribosyl)anthranilate isomerase n=1 Tax=Candidatus Methylospira mobilis TaxID=1808979 RepID=A0A5Q0BKB5_9GAMM|nr:phosphoribosylanthranilate isomerase [Candidatus Methylospira mobilis]QFY42567.1 phosphoribosylanthranilate isomerase [Candidatus Methylospira mobilis]WNV04318.1 phosphoribosylanthranilate isomerase [Candidatus Methylospira mobilis]
MKLTYPKTRTRVKICGFTRAQDAVAAARLGADAIGLVFYAPSPRHVAVETAREIVASLPAFTTVSGLFVDAAEEQVRDVLAQVRLDLLQFHGSETPEYCRQFERRYIKSVAMRSDTDLDALASHYADAAGLLLDVDNPAAKGGTGTAFDWGLVPWQCRLPLIVAGGLSPENVGAALAQTRPYAVDVSSGVESAKGIKEQQRMAAFLDEVCRFDYEQR